MPLLNWVHCLDRNVPAPRSTFGVPRVHVRLFLLFTSSLFSLLLSPFPALQAQSPAQRDSIESFRDSLAPVQDTTTLRALEARLIVLAKGDRDNPMRHYRLGFVALRLGDAGRKDSYDDAAGEFQWATEVAPKEPYGWYGLGLAENAIGDSRFTLVAGLQAMFGKDHLTRAALNYAKAAEVDPSFVRGLLELGNTALEQRMNIKLDAALLAFRAAARTEAGKNPQVLLVRGRVERLAGDPDSALAAFKAYTASATADTALGLLEVGRTLFLLGSLDGEAPYYRAAALDDSASVTGLRADLRTLVGDTGLGKFDAHRGPARAAWLRTFWGDRDAADLRSPGERLREHYRRLFYAREHFRLVSIKRHYNIEERYRSYDRDFDDRGLIYIRHGEPSERASAHGTGLEPNESWRYERPDGDLIFHFVAREDVQDYRLVGSLFDILGFDTATAIASGTDAASRANSIRDFTGNRTAGLPDNIRVVAQDLLVTREHLAPIYGRLLATNVEGSNLLASERQLSEESIRRGTTTDSYMLSFDGGLDNARWSLLVAGRSGDSEVTHLVYAIPSQSLQPLTAAQGTIYQVRVRLSVLRGDGGVAATLDSTSFFLTHAPLKAGDWLVGRVAVTLPSGRYRYRIALQNGDADGFSTAPDTLGVPTPGDFGVSDIVLGTRNSHLVWQEAGGDTVFFNPVGALRPGVPLEIYYQVFGLRAGEQFRTQLRVRRPGSGGIFGPLVRLFGGGGAAVSVGFEGTSPGAVAEVHRAVATDRLAAGPYALELVITRANGQSIRRQSVFRVLPPQTTVVPPSP
ncbi:MAG: tetratricopeptide repeat protein [Gemmatimonadales bacterium]